MLIVLLPNIYKANYLRIDIRYLLAQSTGHEITLLSVSQIEMRQIIIFLSNILMCGLNTGMDNSADDCLNKNKNIIIVIIILVLLHIRQKIS